jgi:hypothetical protein
MFRRVLALMTVAALCGCDRLTAPEPAARAASVSGVSYAKAQTTKTNNSTETTFPPMTACDGDVVVFHGSAHTVTTVTVSGANAHVDQHFNTQDVFGVGASGIVYRLAEIYKVDEDMNLQSAHVEEDFKGQIRVISRGNTDNMLLDAIYHFSFDVSPAGQPVNMRTTVVKLNARCRG